MKLHGKVIYYLLSKEISCMYYTEKEDIAVDSPVFYDEGEDMKGHLVVMGMKDKPYNLHEAILLYPYGCEYRNTSHAIVVTEDVPVSLVFNKLLKIYSIFNIWENKMTEHVRSHSSFSDLIGQCDDILREPMSLIDNQFRYVTYTQQLSKERGFVERYVDNNVVPMEIVQKLRAITDYTKIYKIKNVYDHPSENNFIVKQSINF